MRVCIVGYGSMGKNHARVLTGMGHEVQSLDPSAAAGADHFMLTPELIGWTEVVCIATPIDDLNGVASAWLDRGKDVLVEKPGSIGFEDLRSLHIRAAKRDNKLFVGYTERHNPVVAALKANLHLVGELRHIAICRLGFVRPEVPYADPALDLAVHDLDVLDYLGLDVELWHYTRSARHVVALLQGDLFSVSIEASHLHPSKTRDLEVVGASGVLQVSYQHQTLGFIGHDGSMRTALPVDKGEPLVNEWRAFFDGESSDGTKALAIAEQMSPHRAVFDEGETGRWSESRRGPLAAAP